MDNSRFRPLGAASYQVSYDGPPRDFYFLMLPRLTMLAFAAAVEPLRISNQLTGKCLYRWFTLSEDGRPVVCSNGIEVPADMELQQLPKTAWAFVCAGVEPQEKIAAGTLNWLLYHQRIGGQVGGLCTGAYALVQAGVLRDAQFTLHWENRPAFEEHYPGYTPSVQIYEIDKGVYTCGGGTAATDMMLAIIEQHHGQQMTMMVADMCVHGLNRRRAEPQQSASRWPSAAATSACWR